MPDSKPVTDSWLQKLGRSGPRIAFIVLTLIAVWIFIESKLRSATTTKVASVETSAENSQPPTSARSENLCGTRGARGYCEGTRTIEPGQRVSIFVSGQCIYWPTYYEDRVDYYTGIPGNTRLADPRGHNDAPVHEFALKDGVSDSIVFMFTIKPPPPGGCWQ